MILSTQTKSNIIWLTAAHKLRLTLNCNQGLDLEEIRSSYQ